MIRCEICKKEYNIFTALCVHLSRTHNIRTQEQKKQYYDIYMKTDNDGKCLYCGKDTKYSNWSYKNYCNRSCQFKHNQSKMLKTMKEKYGTEYAAQSKECRAKMEATCVKRHGVRSCWWTEEGKRKAYEQNQRPESKKIRYEHMRQTNLEKYGIEYTICNEKSIINSHSEEANEKRKVTCIEHFGVDHPFKSEEIRDKIKQTMIETYGVDNGFKLESAQIRKNSSEARRKAAITMRKNGHKSKAEDRLEKAFQDNNINYMTEYSSDVYPFNCDFYLVDLDIYLELNLYPMHNNHFYDCTNEDDLKLEKIIREKAKTSNWYKKMIEVWLDRDVRKLEYAKKNKLNYIVLWTEEELDQFILNLDSLKE